MQPLSRWPLHRWVVVAAPLVLAALFPLFTGLAFLQFGPVPYFLAVIVILAIWIIARPNRWVELALGIVTFVFMLLNLPFIGPSLTRPDHYPDYIYSIYGPFLAILALISGIVAVTPRGRAATSVRAGSWALAVVLLVAGFGIGIATAMTQVHALPGTGGGAVDITPDTNLTLTAKNDKFSAPVQIAANQIAHIAVTNADSGGHNFHVDDLGIATDLAAGKVTDVWVRTAKTGTYQLYCSLHSSKGSDGKWAGMVTEFTVS